jgi:hypothetical protein
VQSKPPYGPHEQLMHPASEPAPREPQPSPGPQGAHWAHPLVGAGDPQLVHSNVPEALQAHSSAQVLVPVGPTLQP